MGLPIIQVLIPTAFSTLQESTNRIRSLDEASLKIFSTEPGKLAFDGMDSQNLSNLILCTNY